jgi:hypothetical protein
VIMSGLVARDLSDPVLSRAGCAGGGPFPIVGLTCALRSSAWAGDKPLLAPMAAFDEADAGFSLLQVPPIDRRGPLREADVDYLARARPDCPDCRQAR